MAKVCVSDGLAVLADVAEAVGRLGRVLPAEWDLDALREEVKRIGDVILDERMSPAEEAEAGESQAAPDARRKGGRPRKTTAAAPKADKEKKDAPKRPVANPTCELCGDAFVRKGPRQKYCQGCAAKRDADSKAAWYARKRGEPGEPAGRNPSATPDRLERIRAANERLDRIPDETGKGGSGQ